MDLLIQLGIFALLLLVGLVFGRAAEARHFRELQRREAELAEARRVARRWVVMKSSDPSVFPGLGLEALIPAAGAPVFWGRAHGNP